MLPSPPVTSRGLFARKGTNQEREVWRANCDRIARPAVTEIVLPHQRL